MHNQGEPSVEEILDSIKKVIARDSRERDEMIATRRGRSLVSESSDAIGLQEPHVEDEILELGEDLGEELVHEDVIEEVEIDFTDEAQSEGEEDALTRGDAREAMRQNFAALSMLAQPGKQPQIVRQGETSLEGLTRELLRPMLAQWLDDNLPAMVEELVKAEIARIAGKKS